MPWTRRYPWRSLGSLGQLDVILDARLLEAHPAADNPNLEPREGIPCQNIQQAEDRWAVVITNQSIRKSGAGDSTQEDRKKFR